MSRREFIKGALAAGTTIGLGLSTATGAPGASPDKD